MTTTFPASLDSYSTRLNNIDTVAASHVNDLQDAVVALETAVAIGAISRTAWTPTFTYSTTAPTSITYDTANTGGWYAQVAKVVFFTLRFSITAISGGSGNIVLSLPSATTTGNFALASASVNTATGTWTVFPMVGRTAANSATMNLFSYASGTGFTVLAQGNVGTPSVGTPLAMIASGFYFVT